MSAAHDDAHAHAPEQPEVSHPLLWSVLILGIMAFLAWLFFHYLFHGMHVARHEEKITVHRAAEPEPDHEKLAKNVSPEVIDAGQAIYNAKCASCHGAQGNSNPSNLKPAPRNFHTDAWKNPNGGSPYALYLVVSKGMGTMPAFPGLSPQQRYAVNHFIVETWTKKDNHHCYEAENPEALKKQIPAPGAAGEHGGERHPELVEAKAPVLPLLAGLAKHGDEEVHALRAWAALARRGAKPETAALANDFVALVEVEPSLAGRVQEAVRSNDRTRFDALLAGSDGSGAVRADFSLASADQLGGLFELLKGVK
jgi:mono/diheme cytochrome c family protein